MIEVSLNGVEKYYGSNLIFKDINFDVKSKERVAIIGRNGCGKSSIFKIIVNKENKDRGDILIRKGSKIGYLEQIPEFENYKVRQILNLGFPHLIDIEEKLRELESKMQSMDHDINNILEKYSNLQLKYEKLGGYEKETTISKVCSGLNMSEAFLESEFETLSGGEKTRVMLGKILVEKPDILLLDEPTNHIGRRFPEYADASIFCHLSPIIIIAKLVKITPAAIINPNNLMNII